MYSKAAEPLEICQYCTSRLYRSKGLTKRRWAGLVLILFTKEYVGKRHARGRDVINAEATFSLRGEVDCHTLQLVFALHASRLRKILERLSKTSTKTSRGMAMESYVVAPFDVLGSRRQVFTAAEFPTGCGACDCTDFTAPSIL